MKITCLKTNSALWYQTFAQVNKRVSGASEALLNDTLFSLLDHSVTIVEPIQVFSDGKCKNYIQIG